MKQRCWQIGWQSLPGCLTAAAIALMLKLNALTPFEQITYRTLFQLRGARSWDDRIVLVKIDEPSLQQLGRFPWSRQYYTKLLKVLTTKNPSIVVMDLLWSESSPQDPALAAAMSQQGHTILAQAWDQAGLPLQPVADLAQSAIATGHVMKQLDTDGVVRTMQLQLQDQPTLAVVAAQAYSLVQRPVTLPPFDRPLWINWVSPAAQLPAYSFVDVIRGNIPAAAFHNKIVLVGVTATGFDPLITPFDQNPPASSVYLHATVLNNLLQQTSLRPLSEHPLWLWGLLLSAPAWSWLLSRWQTRSKLLAVIGLCGVWCGLGLILFQANYWLPIAPPLILWIATTAGVALRDRCQEDHLLRQQIAYLWQQYQQDLVMETGHPTANALPGLDQRFPAPRTSLLRVTQLAALADQLGRSQQLLQQAKALAVEQAEQSAAASHAKSEFLANMSHELRTPLNVILGFAQVISHDTTLDPKHQEHLHIIKRSGQHLLGLINDVLEMSKVEAGRIQLQATSFNLHRLLDDLERMLQVRVQGKPVLLRVERSPQVPPYIWGDEGKLRQVLLNLLGNAIKFTAQGQVSLHVTGELGQPVKYAHNSVDRGVASPDSPAASVSPARPVSLQFEVTDTGLGIAPEELQQVFQPFTQAAAGQRAHEGTGLGLSISQKYVQLMGGEITVQSTLAQGSTFKFQIQVQQVASCDVPAALPPERVLAIAPTSRPYRILIVEDHLENRQLLTALLLPLGFELRTAQHGAEGIELWQQWQPDLILMDIRMPVMDGITAIQTIRRLEQHVSPASPQREGESLLVQTAPSTTTKIIVLSASVFTNDRQTAIDMGCDDFLTKPIQENLLLTKLSEHLGIRFIYEAVPALGEPLGVVAATAVSIVDLQTALAQMPLDWVQQLEQSAIKGSDEKILHLIAHIPPCYSHLAAVLNDWVSCFQFDDILHLTRSRLP